MQAGGVRLGTGGGGASDQGFIEDGLGVREEGCGGEWRVAALDVQGL